MEWNVVWATRTTVRRPLFLRSTPPHNLTIPPRRVITDVQDRQLVLAGGTAADVRDMVRARVHHLFVADDAGKIVGVISPCDVLPHLE